MDLKGSHFEKEIILWGVSMVCGLPDLLSAIRGDDVGAWGGRGSLHAQSLGDQVCPGV
jgi:hypothetical protein